jgi:hypothetical protein
MSTQQLYRSLGLAAHLGWARLLVDRSRNLVEVPAPTREGPGGGLHHFAPDDEGTFEYENYHSPDHTYWCGRGSLVVASGRRSLRQARSRCEWLRGREVAGLRVGSTTRPTLAPSVACAAPAGPPVEEKKQAVSPTPFFSLLFSTSFPQSSPKRSSFAKGILSS